MRDRVFQTELQRLGRRTAVLSGSEIDDRFNRFWEDFAGEGRLTARRDAAAWCWRLTDPDRTRDPIPLAWMDGGEIGGLLLAQMSKVSEIQCPTLEVIDLVALAPFARQAAPELI